MPQVDFYHLTKSELPDALVLLIEKSRQAGRKALIHCPRPAAEAIDDDLWTREPDTWLPHGLDDGEGTSHAVAWIVSEGKANPISAEFLFLLHGAEREDMASFERVFNLFDGRSEAQVDQARAQWQAWRGMAGLEMRYFAQDDEGKWEQRA
jgi:DNA polymerase-3 subunit chi